MNLPARTVVEFQVDEARCRGYAGAPGVCEVLFASADEPPRKDFAWMHLPGGRAGRLRRWLALAHALRSSPAEGWAAVHPGTADMLFLAWLARRQGANIEFWLDERQGAQWLVFLALRAFGSQAEATHWRTGLACTK